MDNTTQRESAIESAVVKYDNPKDVLIAARKLIENPDRWCKGALARRRDGTGMVGTVSDDAISFCINGAIMRVCAPHTFPRMSCAFANLAGVDTISFNDHSTHAEVLAAFDRAIEQCAVGDREGAAAGQHQPETSGAP